MQRDVSVIHVGANGANQRTTLQQSQADFLVPPTHTHHDSSSNLFSNSSDDHGLTISPSSSLVIPQHLTEEEDDRTFKCCDCERGLTHCYFLLACCWFMLASSFARLLAIGDIILHIVVYVIEIASGDSFFKALHDDWVSFRYKTRCLDLLVLSMFRTIACYWLYAYKRQLDRQVVWAAFVIMATSLTYCMVKIFVVTSNGVRAVAIFSTVYTFGEWVVFQILRRRRVLVERNDRQLDSDVDIESGGFIHYNTQQYQSPADQLFTNNQSDYPTPQNGNKTGPEGENLFTGLDGLDKPAPEVAPAVRKSAVGPRRHKSTATMKIGGVGSRADVASPSSLSLMTATNDTNTQKDLLSTPTTNNIYSPSPHHAIVYAPQIPAQIQRISHPNSQFLTFEGVRIHYKFIVNPTYQPYFDHLYSTNVLSDSVASISQLPDHLQAHQIPPCMILIHGFISTLFDFDHLAAILHNYSAILIFDRPGFGLSSMLTEQDIEYREHQFRSHQLRQQSVQAEITKLNQFLSQQNAEETTSTDPFTGLIPDEHNPHSDQKNQSQNQQHQQQQEQTAVKKPDQPGQLMANVYDFYSLIKAYCPDHHPYRSQFIIRLISTFMHVYKLHHLGVILGGHHSGGTLALSTLVEYSKIYTQLSSNPLLAQFVHSKTRAIKSPIRGLILFAASIYDDGFPPFVKNIFGTSLGKQMVKALLNSECGNVALKRAFYNPDNIPPGLIKIHTVLNKYIPNKDDALYTMALTEVQNDVTEGYINYIIAGLEQIEVPVLVVHGEDDKIVPITSTTRIIRALSGSSSIQCVRISQCGHLSFEEAADTVASSVDSFLSVQTRYKIYQNTKPDA